MMDFQSVRLVLEFSVSLEDLGSLCSVCKEFNMFLRDVRLHASVAKSYYESAKGSFTISRRWFDSAADKGHLASYLAMSMFHAKGMGGLTRDMERAKYMQRDLKASMNGRELTHTDRVALQQMAKLVDERMTTCGNVDCKKRVNVYKIQKYLRFITKTTPLITLKTCANCHVETYCNTRCQRQHWAIHRQVCAEDAADGGAL